jgi:hypothetical protein
MKMAQAMMRTTKLTLFMKTNAVIIIAVGVPSVRIAASTVGLIDILLSVIEYIISTLSVLVRTVMVTVILYAMFGIKILLYIDRTFQ